MISECELTVENEAQISPDMFGKEQRTTNKR